MTEFGQARPPRRKVNTWPQVIIASLVVGAWGAWRTIVKPGQGAELGSALAGGNLDLFVAGWLGGALLQVTLAAMVVWVVMTFVFLRKVKEDRAGRNLGILWLAALLGSAAPLLIVGAMLTFGAGPIQTAERSMTADVQAALGPNGPALSTTPRAGGDTGQIERVLRTLIAGRIADEKALQTALKDLDFPNFVKPAALAVPGVLPKSEQKVVRIKVLIEQFRARQDMRLAQARAGLEALTIRSSLREKVLSDYDSLVETARFDRTRYWDLLYSSAFEMQQMIRQLRRPNGRWSLRGDAMTFTNDADLKAYNAHATKLNSILAEIQAVSARAYQSPVGSTQTKPSDARTIDFENDPNLDERLK
ncbi:preprotein translocase subunit SecG [Caulobacter ginsengisoli]|uniref:Preprotein translocase subunit SecG n=1 Tax=Caulobacter ginsengisoli TaxID=400775 RepID=A0ABU0IX80_9CAUL|nr:hypothetical protein [Caulobacter ginsengisoli]MDQ0466617.1 preprotein translocase subunit SecG [Caulobacter ginsengisoli]